MANFQLDDLFDFIFKLNDSTRFLFLSLYSIAIHFDFSH